MSTWTWQLHEIFCVALRVWPMPDSPYWSACCCCGICRLPDLWIIPAIGPAVVCVFLCTGTCSWKLLLNVFLLLWGNLCVEVSMNVVNLVRDISELVCLWRDYLHAWRCNCTVIGTGIKLIIFKKKKNLCA